MEVVFVLAGQKWLVIMKREGFLDLMDGIMGQITIACRGMDAYIRSART